MKREDQIKKAAEIIAYGCSDELKAALIKDFPELAESEDEKIRKELLEEIEFIIPHDDETDSEGLILPSYHARIDRYKSYLEKQKEQKKVDTQDLPHWKRMIGACGSGDDGPSAPNPSDVGIAIDTIVSHFDGGLHVGEYKLADDCTCHIANRTVIVTQKVSRLIQPGDYRCRDCKNQIVGRSTCTAWYDTEVCSLKPKKTKGSRQLYYCAPDTRKPCEMFELKSK